MVKLGLNKADVAVGKSKNCPDGTYNVRICAVRFEPSKRPENKGNDFFKVEFAVTKVVRTKGEVEVGEKFTCLRNSKYDQTINDIKAFCVAAAGISPLDKKAIKDSTIDWDDFFGSAVGDDNPLMDLEMTVEVTTIITEKNKHEMSLFRWFPLADGEEAAA